MGILEYLCFMGMFYNRLRPVLSNIISKIDLIGSITLNDHEGHLETAEQVVDSECTKQMISCNSIDNEAVKKIQSLPARDIVCAFNYSCCCLQRREELVLYFKHALSSLSKRGGIFVMDLYGGTSSERKLRLQRRFSNFTVSCWCSI